MVKLRVTARVIPEDTYLTPVETTLSQHALIRGEKRFFVIVREPEHWYIGTLAVEVTRRYAALYKHDLGKIKYLKDNTDDCDLDPEFLVSDALVDEGRALKDPSDQHVTIKVIQEQGRAVRAGSVVPDLSQVHYQLPERPARPPVPTFHDIGSSLGKRKPDEIVQRSSVENKRTRLDEIEETGIYASVEQDQPSASDIVVENSQPSRTSPVPTGPSRNERVNSPELRWSFDQVGPPIAAQEVSIQTIDMPDQPNHGQSHRTPSASSTGLKTPQMNGIQTMSPLAAASSASKKFLMPRAAALESPESDIDDSQMSPSSRDTSRITPRLIPSGRNNTDMESTTKRKSNGNANRMTFSSDESEVSEDTASASVSAETNGINGSRDAAENLNKMNTNSQPETDIARASSTVATNIPDLMQRDTEPDSSARIVLNSALSSAAQSDGLSHITKAFEGSGNASKPTKSAPSDVLQALNVNGSSKSASKSASESPSNAESFASDANPQPPKKKRVRVRRKPTVAAQNAPNGDTGHSTPASKILNSADSTAKKRGLSDIDTPSRDSPSEQLDLALQESVRKFTDKAPLLRKSRLSGNSPPVDKSDSSVNNFQPAQEPPPKTGATAGRVEATISTTSIRERRKSTSAGAASSQAAEPDKLTIPVVNQTVRKSSADSQGTNIFKTILPPGMTQEEYDRVVKGNSRLNVARLNAPAKRRSTPSLRQTPSVELPSGDGELSRAGKKSVVKPTASLKTTDETANTTKVGTKPSTSKSEGQKAMANTKKNATTESENATGVAKTPKTNGLKDDKQPTPVTLTKQASTASTSNRTPSLARSESAASGGSKSGSVRVSFVSIPKTSTSVKTPSQSAAKPSAVSASRQKQSTPTPSTASEATSSSISTTKPKAKDPTSSVLKSMPPPSSLSVATKTSRLETPTPKPKAKPAVSVPATNTPSASKPPTSSAPSTSKIVPTPTPKPKPTIATRPSLQPTFSSARSLQELRDMARSSANTSASTSPGPSMLKSRFAPPKKSILDDDSTSESSSDSDSDSETNAPSKSKPNPSTTSKPSESTLTKPAIPQDRPDPTIRDATDNDDDSDEDSNDAGSRSG